jgi:hypothetical protein
MKNNDISLGHYLKEHYHMISIALSCHLAITALLAAAMIRVFIV